MHWIRDHKKLLSNTYNALKADGIVRFNFAAKGNCSYFIKVVREIMKSEDFAGYFKNFKWPWYMPPIDKYEVLVKTFSFKEVKIWGEKEDTYFKNAEEMTGWIDQPSIVPFLKHLDNDTVKRSFRDLAVNKMIEKTLQKDGTYFEAFRRVNLFARK